MEAFLRLRSDRQARTGFAAELRVIDVPRQHPEIVKGGLSDSAAGLVLLTCVQCGGNPTPGPYNREDKQIVARHVYA